MSLLTNREITCPYCGETIEIIIDCSVTEQVYIEDCEVCCRPMQLMISIKSQNEIIVNVKHENDCL